MAKKKNSDPVVSIIMGSKSDWPTMEIASLTLTEIGVLHESRIISARRTPVFCSNLHSPPKKRHRSIIGAVAWADEGNAVTKAHLVSLLQRFEAAGLDVIKTENLYNFDGARGYSA